jgi:hypothetical protein
LDISSLKTKAPHRAPPPIQDRRLDGGDAFLAVVLDFIFKSGKSINRLR